MKLFQKKVTRRDFLKYSLASALLAGLATIGIKTKKDKKDNNYGAMPYGGKR